MIVPNNIRFLMLAMGAVMLLAVAAHACDDDRHCNNHCRRGHDNDRKGLMLGFNMGGANAQLEYQRNGAKVEREIEGGAGGAFRIGYGLSDAFVLGFEMHGIHRKDGPLEMSSGAGLVTATWYPGGGGFFLRAGVGSSMTTLSLPAPNGVAWEEREGDAGLLGLGYEWRLGNQFALGIAVDGVGAEYTDTTGYHDTRFGFGSASLQLNWFL